MRTLVFLVICCGGFLFAYQDLGTFGNVIGPSEPDMMEDITAKAKDINKTRVILNVKNALQKEIQPNFHVVSCDINQTRNIVPNYTLKEDVVMPGGKVLYKKGYSFNPLSKIKFPGVIAFINPQEDSQIQIAKRLNSKIIFISEGNITGIEKKHGQRVEPISEKVVEAFSLKCIPSFYKQDGETLKIKEINAMETK